MDSTIFGWSAATKSKGGVILSSSIAEFSKASEEWGVIVCSIAVWLEATKLGGVILSTIVSGWSVDAGVGGVVLYSAIDKWLVAFFWSIVE